MSDLANPGRPIGAEQRVPSMPPSEFGRQTDDQLAWWLRNGAELALADAERQAKAQGRGLDGERLRVEIVLRVREE